jgi:uncharacterized protein YdbL (DUF1318 family)
MLATVVDLDAMWKILLAAFAVGVGVTAIFGEGALAAQRVAAARRQGRLGETVVNGLVVAFAALVCAAAIVVGFVAMMHKT